MLQARLSHGAPAKVVKILTSLLVLVSAWPGLTVSQANAAPMPPTSKSASALRDNAPARAALNAPTDDVVLQGHVALLSRGSPPNARWSVSKIPMLNVR